MMPGSGDARGSTIFSIRNTVRSTRRIVHLRYSWLHVPKECRMNITVSVFGRLHAFYLAHQLEKRGSLDRLFTTYPRSEVQKYGISRSKVTAFPSMEAAFRFWLKLPHSLNWGNGMLVKFAEWYDGTVCGRLQTGSDIFHGWSTYSERSLIRAKELGMICTLQRGSAHIEFQRDILQEEHDLQGSSGVMPHAAVVQREMREYEIADYIFVPSEFARRTFVDKNLPASKIIKVPLGVSLKQFYETPKVDNVFRVIYAGTMSLQKGVHYLIRAFTELRLPNAELWLVGQMQPEMEKIFKQYEGGFRYFGKVPQEQLRDLYGQCSLFALCSVQDGFGVVLTQAMACGLPVLCSTNTGGSDVLTDGCEGYIVPIRDVQAIKERLLFLCEHPEACVEMGRRARTRAASTASWDDYGSQMYSAFQAILPGSTT
jgi:glycosyltransferase involved in cell wall biosynthesis